MMRVLPLALAALLPLTAHAEGSGLVALETSDAGRGLQAVGRINLGERGFCTGTLIAEDLVLTAGHCLFDKETGARLPLEDFEFRAGWRNGRAEAYRHVRAAALLPDYVYSGEEDLDRVAFDIALLQLDQPVRLPQVRPFATGATPALGDTVSVVSYALDREEAPSIESGCAVLDQGMGLSVLSCHVDFGASGSPVLQEGAGGLQVVSVISAKAEGQGGQKVSLATPLAEHLQALKDQLGATGRPGKVRLLSSGGGSGAKFVKP